jgi:hypothetical protein
VNVNSVADVSETHIIPPPTIIRVEVSRISDCSCLGSNRLTGEEWDLVPSPGPIGTVNQNLYNIYTNTHPTHFDPDDGGSVYRRNSDNATQIHTLQRPNSRNYMRRYVIWCLRDWGRKWITDMRNLRVKCSRM